MLGRLMYGSFDLWSYTISWLFQNLSIRFLKEFTLGALTTSVGSEFQELTTLCVNDSLLSFFRLRPFSRYMLWPLNTRDVSLERIVRHGATFISYIPCIILYTSIISPLRRRYTRVGRFNFCSLSYYIHVSLVCPWPWLWGDVSSFFAPKWPRQREGGGNDVIYESIRGDVSSFFGGDVSSFF